jgi:hypothetical protein
VITYPKINSIFKRYMDGPKKGKLIIGEYSDPVFKYLARNQWEYTEKVDGTNWRIGFRRHEDSLEVEFGGRTDNAVLPKPLLAQLQEQFPSSPRGSGENALVGRWMIDNDLTDVALFGEGYGHKIQNGGNYRDDQAFVLFDVKIGDYWLERKDVNDDASKLGLESVPTIGYGTLLDAVDIVTSGITFGDSGGVVRWGSGGLQSRWGNFEAEGIVARPLVPLSNRRGERVICKIKGKDFK